MVCYGDVAGLCGFGADLQDDDDWSEDQDFDDDWED